MNKDIEFIRQVVRRHLDTGKYRVFVFGSRARGDASRFSDYDLGIEGEKLPAGVYFNLVSEFEESDFPFRVDVVEFRDVSEAFKKIAKQDVIEID